MHFETVYRAHFAAIWRVVRRFGVPEKDALDATQEVFVVAYRRRHEFEARSKIETWLIGIAYRIVANRLRSAACRREVLGNEAILRQLSHTDTHAEVEHRILLLQLEAALDQLSLEQRAVFTMFELEEFSGDEIATALGIPVGTVRSRLRLARQAFRQAAKHIYQDSSTAKLSEGGL